MSRFKVDLKKKTGQSGNKSPAILTDQIGPEKPSVFVKVLKIFAILVLLFVVIGGAAGFFYWQYLKTTPQYSLALLVDAARQNDQNKIDELVDTDAVVDDFLPQITGKAVEIYGRGLPDDVLKKVTRVAAPLMPAVKQRARAELPELIRSKTKKFDGIPFWAIAAGANRYLDINQIGDRAFIKSKIEGRQLEVEMKKKGDLWQVVGVKDEALAQQIAQKIGKEIMEMANNKGKENLEKIGKELGVENMKDVFEDFTDIFDQ